MRLIDGLQSVKNIYLYFCPQSSIYCHEVLADVDMLARTCSFLLLVCHKCVEETEKTLNSACVLRMSAKLACMRAVMRQLRDLRMENAQRFEERTQPSRFLLLTFCSTAVQSHTFHSACCHSFKVIAEPLLEPHKHSASRD